MTPTPKRLIALLTALLLTLSLTACEHSEHGEAHDAVPELEATTPLVKDIFVDREYVAQIHAYRRIDVRAMERGYIEKIFVDEGQWVRQGDPMFQLVQTQFRAELEKAIAEANALEIEYRNTQALAEKNIVSPNELALAKAKLEKAKAEVKMAQAHLDWTRINAPFDGFVDRLEVRVGSLVDESERLTTLSDTRKMWVYFNLPEAEYLDYVSGKSKRTTLKVRLKLANGEIYPHPGLIETVLADFDNTTGNIELRASFPNPDNILRHGQTGSILLATPYKNAVIIPQKATFEILDKTYVYVVGFDGRVEQRPITIAAELPHLFVVEKGLGKNDRILLEGLRKTKPGQRVEVRLKSPEAVISELNLYAE